ncbi:hypothetical protein [Methanohalophilus sp. DAL1]|nr:hypothetical protein [Methanohalophilus sp. DAL1]
MSGIVYLKLIGGWMKVLSSEAIVDGTVSVVKTGVYNSGMKK